MMSRKQLEKLGKEAIDSIFEVHRELGPGLLETTYEMALCREFSLRKLRFERQKSAAASYKGADLDCGFRIDPLLEDEIVLELKSVESLLAVHDAQIINYLRLANKRLGFLVNFNVPRVKDGIRRRVNNLEEDPLRPANFLS
jgi:GxxExxY protein